MNRAPLLILGGAIVLAVVAALITADRVAAGDARANAASERRANAEAELADVQRDVRRSERYLTDFTTTIGQSLLPRDRTPVSPPLGVKEGLLTGQLILGDFHDTFVDEGIVIRGIEAREVEKIANRPVDTLPPRPQAPTTVRSGYRLIEVRLRVTNRSGRATDPACGIDSTFNAYAYDDLGGRGEFARPSYDNVGTYLTSCGAGLADGASGDIVVGVALPEKRKLKAVLFQFFNDEWRDDVEGSDGFSQVLVFKRPV